MGLHFWYIIIICHAVCYQQLPTIVSYCLAHTGNKKRRKGGLLDTFGKDEKVSYVKVVLVELFLISIRWNQKYKHELLLLWHHSNPAWKKCSSAAIQVVSEKIIILLQKKWTKQSNNTLMAKNIIFLCVTRFWSSFTIPFAGAYLRLKSLLFG